MKDLILKLLPSALIILLFLFIRKSDKMHDIDESIKQYKKENDSLRLVNNQILENIQWYNQKLIKSDEVISGLVSSSNQLAGRISVIGSQINKLKAEYEKANNHADNFNSTDIQRYFADSLGQY